MRGERSGSRAQLIERARAAFARRGARWFMALLVAATAGIGMLASVALLALGLQIIWLRYVIAVTVAYAGFLALIRWWLAASGATGPRYVGNDAENIVDAIDSTFRGLDFVTDGDGVTLPDVGFDLPAPDFDEGGVAIALIVVLALAALAGLLASGFLIYTAPAFFAEVFVDAALSYGLYRRLSSAEPQHWLQTAVARTWMPFLVVAVVLGLAGATMHALVPDAVSIGDVWRAGAI